jgi:hypothetical protein
MSTTPLLGLSLPIVGGDVNDWGQKLNNDLAIIDLLGAADVQIINSNSIIAITRAITILEITGGVIVTLPTPSATIKGRVVLARKMDAVGIASLAASAIEGGTSYFLVNQGQAVVLVADSLSWWAFARQ